MIGFKNANLDKPKAGKELARIFREGATCKAPGCDKPLTIYQGPGADKLCREHQRQLSDYGGLAVLDKMYSFVRGTLCQECGYDAAIDPRITGIHDEVVRNRVIRDVMGVDHINGTHFDDDLDNLKCLCARCHAIKSGTNGDYLTPAKSNI